MSFIVPFCALLVALLVAIVVDGIGLKRRRSAQRDVPRYDTW